MEFPAECVQSTLIPAASWSSPFLSCFVSGVLSPQGLMSDDLRWSWRNSNRNKAHHNWNVRESSETNPQSVEKLSSTKLVPGAKKVGDHCSIFFPKPSHYWFHLQKVSEIHLLLSNCLPPTCSGHLGHLSQHTSLCLLGLFPIFLKCEICYSHSPQKTQPKTNLGNKQALLSFSVMSHNLQLKLWS